MAVETIAREDVATVEADEPVSAVVRVMEDRNLGSVVVVDDGPVGIVTDRDLVMRVMAPDRDPDELTAREVMSDDLYAVDSETGLLDLLGEMGEVGVRRAPIVDEDGELIGIVTLDDLIVLLSMELESIANIIRAESPPYEVDATDLF